MGPKLIRRCFAQVLLAWPLWAGTAGIPAPKDTTAIVNLAGLAGEIDSQPGFLVTSLGRARALAESKMRSGRFAEAWSLPDAIASIYPGLPFILFWPREEELMAFLSGRWEKLTEPGLWQRGFSKGYSGKTVPVRDDLEEKLYALLLAKKDSVSANLSGATLEPFQVDFLQMVLLGHVASAGPGHSPGRNEFNRLADAWLLKYPDRPYAAYVRSNFRYVEEPGWLGGGVDFSLGGNLPLGALGQTFDRKAAYGFGFEIMLWRLSLRGELSSDPWAESRRNFLLDGHEWNAGDNYALTYAELQIGGEIWRTRDWLVVPYASWGILEFANQGLDDRLGDDEDAAVHRNERSLGWGAHVQKFFGAHDVPGDYFLGLSFGMHYPQLWRSFPGLTGSEAFLQVHIGLKGRRWDRDL